MIPGRPYFFMIRLRKLQRVGLVSLRRDHCLKDLTFVIHGAPQVAELAVDLREDLS